MGLVSKLQFVGGCAKAAEEAVKDLAREAEEPELRHCAGISKEFKAFVGFGFLSMIACGGPALNPHGRLKKREAVEFTLKRSAKGLESITGPGGVFCTGSERPPKGKNMQQRRSKGKNMQKCRSKGDRSYNSGGLDHHAK